MSPSIIKKYEDNVKCVTKFLHNANINWLINMKKWLKFTILIVGMIISYTLSNR